MTEQEAIAEARHWVAVRKEVRAFLIARAREANPFPLALATNSEGEPFTSFTWPNAEVRELWQFPADLSEQRLLELIDK